MVIATGTKIMPPPAILLLEGIPLTAFSSLELMPKRSATFSSASPRASFCVRQLTNGWSGFSSLARKISAVSAGTRMLRDPFAAITGRLNAGLSARNSSTGISANSAARFKSMCLAVETAMKYGLSGI